MTLEQIIADIKSDRVKKVIIDSDTYNEMDDQYAIAHALGSDRLNIVAINAVLFNNSRSNGYADGMEKSYEEILRVLKVTHKEGCCEVFKGCPAPISEQEGFGPVDSPASRNIIKVAHESDEMVYVLALGAITNVASALLMDPTIKDKICVLWLGGHTLDGDRNVDEFNLCQDYRAGQVLLNSGVNLVLMPACGPWGHGTQMLIAKLEDIHTIKGDSDAAVFFRDTLPGEFEKETREWNNGGFARIIWDVAAPAALSVPECVDLKIVTAPVITDDQKYGFDSTRHKMIYMDRIDAKIALEDTFACISKL